MQQVASIPELALGAVAPALDVSVVEHGARVRASGADLHGRALRRVGDVDAVQVVAGAVLWALCGAFSGPHGRSKFAKTEAAVLVV